jgi:hypothetical protein
MVVAVRQDLKTAVLDIVALYVFLRYDRGGNPDDLKRLKVLVGQFSP